MGRKKIVFTTEQESVIRAMRSKNNDYTSISNSVGVSRELVRRHCERHGINKPLTVKNLIRYCEVCGRVLLKGYLLRFCGNECYQIARSKKQYACRYCGKLFTPKAKDRVTFCSRECSYINLRRKKEERANKVRRDKESGIGKSCRIWFLKCEDCGQWITARNPQAKYCDQCNRVRARVNSMRQHLKANPTIYTPRKCKWCGKEYVYTYKSKISTRTCCSIKCVEKMRTETKHNQKVMANHLRRMRMKNVEKERFTRKEIFERDGWRCQICGKRIARNKSFPYPTSATLDHIIPVSRGGSHTRKNVQLVCFMCNSIKSGGTAPGGNQLRLFGNV